jgi:hypothetical protein
LLRNEITCTKNSDESTLPRVENIAEGTYVAYRDVEMDLMYVGKYCMH